MKNENLVKKYVKNPLFKRPTWIKDQKIMTIEIKNIFYRIIFFGNSMNVTVLRITEK